MRVAIFGIGAMGSLFAARLSPCAQVSMIGRWPEQLSALQSDGLCLYTANGARYIAPDDLRATDDPTSLAPVDVALVLTKSSSTVRAARQAAGILAPHGLIVTLQNGIGNLQVIANEAGSEQATLGITSQGASMLKAGVVRYAGPGPTYLATRSEIEFQVQELAALFNRAGFETQVAHNVDGLLWGKLAVNAGINALTAIMRVKNGALLENEWSREMMAEAAREAATVAEAQGIKLPYDDAVQRVETVADMTAANRSSMLQDVLRGATTEIETINGAVMRTGQRLGVPTPVNAMLYRMVKAIEELGKVK